MAGLPQSRYPVIHVAGTNGKGSVVAAVAAALSTCGLRVGRFTSPSTDPGPDAYLGVVSVASRPLSASDCDSVLTPWRSTPEVGVLTPFERRTAAAYLAFATAAVDAAVVECGLGGVRDATNVVPGGAAVCVVTSVALDHTRVLGDSVEAIAAEKAGIVGSSTHAAVAGVGAAAALPLFLDAARAAAGRLEVLHTPCGAAEAAGFAAPAAVVGRPAFEADNAACAMAALFAASRAPAFAALAPRLVPARCSAAVAARMATGGVAGRATVGRRRGGGTFVVDAAHNPAAASALGHFVSSLCRSGGTQRVVAVVATVAEKDSAGVVAAFLAAFAPAVDVLVVPAPLPTPGGASAAAMQAAATSAAASASPGVSVRVAAAAAGLEPTLRATAAATARGEVWVAFGSFSLVAPALQAARASGAEFAAGMEEI